MRGPSWTHGNVMKAEEYLAAQRAFIAHNAAAMPGRYGTVRPYDDDRVVEAYVNHGRWLIDCVCANGVATSPAFAIACCFSCGRIYRSIVFPANAAAIDVVLSARPDITNQNWRPGETVAQLQAENVAHGVAG